MIHQANTPKPVPQLSQIECVRYCIKSKANEGKKTIINNEKKAK